MENFRNFSVISFILFLTFPIVATSAIADTNLVANPSFETGATVPINWTFVTSNGITPTWDNLSHSGAKSIKISIPRKKNTVSGYPMSEPISVTPLTTYTVSAWGKTQNIGGNNVPIIRIAQLNSNKVWIGETYTPGFNKGTNNWIQKTYDLNTLSNTAYIYVYVDIRNGYGTFWLDDVAVSIKTTPAPTPTSTPIPTPTPSNIVQCSTNYCTLDVKQFRLNNNIWGTETTGETNVTQSIYVNTTNNKLGWQWNRQNPQISTCGDYPCPNYPEVTVGTQFGQWNPSSIPYFPIRYGNVSNWTVNLGWIYPQVPTGTNNFAFDIYWMDSTFKIRNYNVMIWIQGNFGQPFDKTVTDGMNEYYYKHIQKSYGPYDVFQLKNQSWSMTNYSVDIKTLLNTISNPEWNAIDANGNILHNNWMIPDLQLGNEVALNFGSSSGKIEINKYNINLNGNLIKLSQ